MTVDERRELRRAGQEEYRRLMLAAGHDPDEGTADQAGRLASLLRQSNRTFTRESTSTV